MLKIRVKFVVISLILLFPYTFIEFLVLFIFQYKCKFASDTRLLGYLINLQYCIKGGSNLYGYNDIESSIEIEYCPTLIRSWDIHYKIGMIPKWSKSHAYLNKMKKVLKGKPDIYKTVFGK